MTCAACHTERAAGELLVVTSVRDGQTFHVCRPSLELPDAQTGSCFRRATGPRSAHTIALAEPGGVTRITPGSFYRNPGLAAETHRTPRLR